MLFLTFHFSDVNFLLARSELIVAVISDLCVGKLVFVRNVWGSVGLCASAAKRFICANSVQFVDLITFYLF